MPEPLSVDSELLKSDQFKEFISILKRAKDNFQTTVREVTPLGEPRTDLDTQVQNLFAQGTPFVEHLLDVLGGLSDGDTARVDELRVILERAEADNVHAANWTPAIGPTRVA